MNTPQRPDGCSQEQWEAWPKCALSSCQNKSCLRLNSKYCWPHTPGSTDEALENLLSGADAEEFAERMDAESDASQGDAI